MNGRGNGILAALCRQIFVPLMLIRLDPDSSGWRLSCGIMGSSAALGPVSLAFSSRDVRALVIQTDEHAADRIVS